MSRARSLARLANSNALTVDTNLNVGIGSTTPEGKVDIRGGDLLVGAAITMGVASGIITATAFYGDGSNLEGVASAGLGTALGEANGLEVIYYTDKVLTVTDDITVDPPATTNIAYTQYAEIAVADSKDLIVADGDDLVPDILGLSTEGITPLAGAGGRIRADLFTNKAGTGAPTFQTGLQVTGVVTATTFDGNVSGEVTLEGAAPATATSTGTAGDIRYDANYVYVCVATNTWKRSALATW